MGHQPNQLNPYLSAVEKPAVEAVNRLASGAGRYGSGVHQAHVFNAAQAARAPAYENQANRDVAMRELGLAAGAQQYGAAQDLYQANLARHAWQEEEPYMWFMRELAPLSELAGISTSTSQSGRTDTRVGDQTYDATRYTTERGTESSSGARRDRDSPFRIAADIFGWAR